MLDEQVAVTTETVESWKEYIRSLKALMRAGQADRATVNQAEASPDSMPKSSFAGFEAAGDGNGKHAVCPALWTPQPIARGTLGEVDFPEGFVGGSAAEFVG